MSSKRIFANIVFGTALLLSAASTHAQDICGAVTQTNQIGVTNTKTQNILSAKSGNAVPADYQEDESVNASTFSNGIYDVVVIPIEVELLERYNIQVPQGVDLDPIVANLEIHQNGHITYNNQDVTQNIKDVCDGKIMPMPKSEQEAARVTNGTEERQLQKPETNSKAAKKTGLISEEVVSQTYDFQSRKTSDSALNKSDNKTENKTNIDGQYPN